MILVKPTKSELLQTISFESCCSSFFVFCDSLFLQSMHGVKESYLWARVMTEKPKVQSNTEETWEGKRTVKDFLSQITILNSFVLFSVLLLYQVLHSTMIALRTQTGTDRERAKWRGLTDTDRHGHLSPMTALSSSKFSSLLPALSN